MPFHLYIHQEQTSLKKQKFQNMLGIGDICTTDPRARQLLRQLFLIENILYQHQNTRSLSFKGHSKARGLNEQRTIP